MKPTAVRAAVIILFTPTLSIAALQPADIVLETDPAVTVTITRRVDNSSTSILLTANPQDNITIKKKCGPQPADKTRTNTCVLPAVGTWDQTSSSIPVPGACWTDGAWSPSQPPEGKCLIPNFRPVIDKTKIPVGPINAGSSYPDVKATTEIAPVGEGAFRTTCKTSHMAFDDPIVFPGKAGQSHLHIFFGNTGANANSTADSLRNTGNSTCRGGIANRSAYWVPALVDTKDGTPLIATDIGTYYKNGYFDGSLIQPMPEGLRMVAGDSAAVGPAMGGTFASRWKCIGGPNKENDKYGPTIGNCDLGAQLWGEVFFPQCWDGVNLDSPNHKSHMSYPVNTKLADGTYKRLCPATHPVILPQVTFNVVYNVTEQDAPLRWRLASDNYAPPAPGGYSWHGDWFNGWRKDISDAWAKNCIKAKKDCHSHLLGDGRMIY